ncbi:MAG: hypothetical protein ACFE0O_06490 [Opitutales bacterium]
MADLHTHPHFRTAGVISRGEPRHCTQWDFSPPRKPRFGSACPIEQLRHRRERALTEPAPGFTAPLKAFFDVWRSR